jgi:hypothetical protein
MITAEHTAITMPKSLLENISENGGYYRNEDIVW